MCVAYFMASSVSFSRRSRHETHYDRLNQSEFAGLSLLREMNNIPSGWISLIHWMKRDFLILMSKAIIRIDYVAIRNNVKAISNADIVISRGFVVEKYPSDRAHRIHISFKSLPTYTPLTPHPYPQSKWLKPFTFQALTIALEWTAFQNAWL